MNEDKTLQTVNGGLPVAASPAEMMQLAIDKNLDLDKVEKMIELQAKWDKMEAEKAYTLAMAEFKKSPPQIFKDRHVKYTTSKGVTEYNHATLGNVTNIVNIALAEHGFSAEWETEQKDANIIVTCILTHKMGHSKRTTLSSGPDLTGGKNSIQAVASTVSYLERYTLLARVGLATHDQDDDGKSAGDPIKYIDDKQKNSIIDMISATESDTVAFLNYLSVNSIDEIPAKRYKEIMATLKRKLEKVKK